MSSWGHLAWIASLVAACTGTGANPNIDVDTDTEVNDDTGIASYCGDVEGDLLDWGTPVQAQAKEENWLFCIEEPTWIHALVTGNDWDSSIDEIQAFRPSGLLADTIVPENEVDSWDIKPGLVAYLDEPGPWTISVQDRYPDYELEILPFLTTMEPDDADHPLVPEHQDDYFTSWGVRLDPGDSDWVQIPRAYTKGPLEVLGSVIGEMDLTITVFDPEGTEQTRLQGVGTEDPHVVVFDGVAGDYLLKIEDSETTSDPEAWGVLWAKTYGDWFGDRHTWEEESNDTQVTGNPIIWDDGTSLIKGFFDPEDDADWFTFSGIEGQWIQNRCSGIYDMEVQAYDEVGTPLKWTPESGSYSERLSLPTSGEYALKFTSQGSHGPEVYWSCTLYLTDEPVFDGE